MKKSYPTWICHECGTKYCRGSPNAHMATYHYGTCDMCGKQVPVTEPRDYGHLKEEAR